MNVKTLALILAVVILAVSVTVHPQWTEIGISKNCNLQARLIYPFFHASFIHAFVNVWCLLGIVFLYDISFWRLLTAYIVAIFVPETLLSDIPTVGLSCVCYTLLGSLIFEVKRKLYFLLSMAVYIAVGFLFPAINASIHVYGYLAGLLVGLLNAPISCFRLKK